MNNFEEKRIEILNHFQGALLEDAKLVINDNKTLFQSLDVKKSVELIDAVLKKILNSDEA